MLNQVEVPVKLMKPESISGSRPPILTVNEDLLEEIDCKNISQYASLNILCGL